MTILDYALAVVFMLLGLWKAIDLINVWATKFANWIIRKIEK